MCEAAWPDAVTLQVAGAYVAEPNAIGELGRALGIGAAREGPGRWGAGATAKAHRQGLGMLRSAIQQVPLCQAAGVYGSCLKGVRWGRLAWSST